jgi:hypothetical protein
VTGIIAFHNGEYYYQLSVERVTGRTVVEPDDDGRAMIADGKTHLEPRA